MEGHGTLGIGQPPAGRGAVPVITRMDGWDGWIWALRLRDDLFEFFTNFSREKNLPIRDVRRAEAAGSQTEHAMRCAYYKVGTRYYY